MKFGLFLGVWENPDAVGNHQQRIQHSVGYVQEAERLGFHSATLTEHHFTGLAQPCSMTLLAYLAAATSRIRLGSAVIILPWHNPLLVAEQIGTLDLLSGGRFDCGLGRGFRYSECRGFGIPGSELQARFDEGLEVLQKCWSEEGRFSHHGRFWHFDDVVIDPKPLQEPHPPVWISVASKPSIERAAEMGYNIMLDSLSDAAAIGERLAYYRACVEARGRVFDPMSVGVTRAFHLTDDEAGTEKAIARHRDVIGNNRRLSVDPSQNDPALYQPPQVATDLREAWLIGQRHEVQQRLQTLHDLGVRNVLLMDAAASLDGLRQFAEDIAPGFADAELSMSA